MADEENQILISPETTAPGTLNDGGIVPAGTRLHDIPIEQFSSRWMKAVTKVDQQKVRSYLHRKEKAKLAEQGPTVEDCLAEIETLREQLKSANGKIGALTQKIEALAAEKKPAPAKKEAPSKEPAAENSAPTAGD